MKKIRVNSKKLLRNLKRVGGSCRLPLSVIKRYGLLALMVLIFIVSAVVLITRTVKRYADVGGHRELQSELTTEKALADFVTDKETGLPCAGVAVVLEGYNIKNEAITGGEVAGATDPVILPKYQTLYEQNSHLIGWLTIEDTIIDYPVMQTPEDEEYYLYKDFYGNENANGCLIMDTDSVVGVGMAEQNYQNGQKPSANLIIHGHTMRNGDMFGNLNLYEDEAYGREHSIICFDSLYEEREYELIAVFYSQVFYKSDDVFKYYKFFQADTQAEFDDWYGNIKSMSLYDIGVEAKFGDEFITLSCCAYHVEDGRFVVVGRRVK